MFLRSDEFLGSDHREHSSFNTRLIALAVGALAPIQMAANAQLAKGVAGTIAATIISFSAGWLFLITINTV